MILSSKGVHNLGARSDSPFGRCKRIHASSRRTVPTSPCVNAAVLEQVPSTQLLCRLSLADPGAIMDGGRREGGKEEGREKVFWQVEQPEAGGRVQM